mgnify:FL=1
MEEKRRTLKQNKALHKYCAEAANECSAIGLTVQALVRNVEADITPELIKELWRSFARVKYGKTSTADLTTKEFVEVGNEVTRHLAQFGVDLHFPSEEDTDEYLKSYENLL